MRADRDVTAYYSAVHDADETLDNALAAIRAQENANRITPAEAAAERIGLYERRIAEGRRLRREHLGGK